MNIPSIICSFYWKLKTCFGFQDSLPQFSSYYLMFLSQSWALIWIMICFLWNDTAKFFLGKKDYGPLNSALQNMNFASVSDSFSNSVVHIPLESRFWTFWDLSITNHSVPVHLLIFVLTKNSHCVGLKNSESCSKEWQMTWAFRHL